MFEAYSLSVNLGLYLFLVIGEMLKFIQFEVREIQDISL